MRIFIRKILTPIFSAETKKKVKRWEYNFRKKLALNLPPITEVRFQEILVEKLKIEMGDHLFVHGSLAMMNVTFSSEEALHLMLEIVGKEGSVSAPTFAVRPSKDTMLDSRKFDVRKTRSGTGALAEAVRKHPDAIRSVHPIKSVASVGAIPDEVFKTHQYSKYSYDQESPYAKLLQYMPKIIGIGVPMRYVSYVHLSEDLDPDGFPLKTNSSERYVKECLDYDGEAHQVSTTVHDMSIVTAANPERFVRRYVNKTHWNIYNYFINPFFSLDANELTNEIQKQAKLNNTIYD